MHDRLRPILVALCCSSAVATPTAAEVVQGQGSLEVSGRKLTCGRVKTELDDELPNLGIAYPDEHVLVLNPLLLRRYSDTVKLFVYNHECGHHHVGGSELGADCWAVEQGVRNGWLDRPRLAEVCASFDNAPETSTHPSGKRRCAALDKCFASVTTRIAAERRQNQIATAKPATPAKAATATILSASAPSPTIQPRLVSGPTFAWQGMAK